MSAVEFPKEIHLILLLHSNILLPYFHRKCGRCAVILLLLLRAIASLASTTECCLSKTSKPYSNDKEEDFVVFLPLKQLLEQDENVTKYFQSKSRKWMIKDGRDSIDLIYRNVDMSGITPIRVNNWLKFLVVHSCLLSWTPSAEQRNIWSLSIIMCIWMKRKNRLERTVYLKTTINSNAVFRKTGFKRWIRSNQTSWKTDG